MLPDKCHVKNDMKKHGLCHVILHVIVYRVILPCYEHVHHKIQGARFEGDSETGLKNTPNRERDLGIKKSKTERK